MSQRTRSLVDWLLLRAWIEPDHERPLRVVVKRPGASYADTGDEQAFADADGAASFVRGWLQGVMRRWESGERSLPPELWDAAEDEDELIEQHWGDN